MQDDRRSLTAKHKRGIGRFRVRVACHHLGSHWTRGGSYQKDESKKVTNNRQGLTRDAATFQGIKFDEQLLGLVFRPRTKTPPPDAPLARTVALEFGQVPLMAVRVNSGEYSIGDSMRST